MLHPRPSRSRSKSPHKSAQAAAKQLRADLFRPLRVESLEERSLLATVTGVTTSGAEIVAGSGFLNEGKVVTLSVNFDAPVNVNTTGGSPRLALNDGGFATYTGGSGSTTLTFDHTVGEFQNSADLAVTAMNLNGGAIQDAASQANATLTGAVTNPAGTLVIDNHHPRVGYGHSNYFTVGVGGSQVPAGGSVQFNMIFSEPVTGVDTDDFALAQYLAKQKIDVLNFNHSRTQNW